jgi:hypothetical protein
VISHDRWFLDRIASHILAFEGDSHVEWFEGNYEDYVKDYRRRVGADDGDRERNRAFMVSGVLGNQQLSQRPELLAPGRSRPPGQPDGSRRSGPSQRHEGQIGRSLLDGKRELR